MASCDAVVTTELVLATPVEVRMPWARASWSTVKLRLPGVAAVESVALTAEDDTVDVYRATPWDIRFDAAVRSPSKLVRSRPTASLCNWTADLRLVSRSIGWRSTATNPLTIELTSMPAAVKLMLFDIGSSVVGGAGRSWCGVVPVRSTDIFGVQWSWFAGARWNALRIGSLGAANAASGLLILLGIALSSIGIVAKNEVLGLFVQTLFTIVAYPIVGLLTMLLYYDARIRKEGFDVEHLSRALGDGTPAR